MFVALVWRPQGILGQCYYGNQWTSSSGPFHLFIFLFLFSFLIPSNLDSKISYFQPCEPVIHSAFIKSDNLLWVVMWCAMNQWSLTDVCHKTVRLKEPTKMPQEPCSRSIILFTWKILFCSLNMWKHWSVNISSNFWNYLCCNWGKENTVFWFSFCLINSLQNACGMNTLTLIDVHSANHISIPHQYHQHWLWMTQNWLQINKFFWLRKSSSHRPIRKQWRSSSFILIFCTVFNFYKNKTTFFAFVLSVPNDVRWINDL